MLLGNNNDAIVIRHDKVAWGDRHPADFDGDMGLHNLHPSSEINGSTASREHREPESGNLVRITNVPVGHQSDCPAAKRRSAE